MARFQDPAASVGATTIRFGDLHRCPSIIQPPSDARRKYSDKPRSFQREEPNTRYTVEMDVSPELVSENAQR